MAIKSYVLTQNFSSPCVQVTGVPHAPQAVRFKKFQKGEIIQGELKHANNQPAFVLVAGKLVVPVSVLKEITAKDIKSGEAISSAEGDTEKKITPEKIIKLKNSDAAIIGGLLGIGFIFLADRQKWIPVPDKKHKIYGALIGAGIGFYAMYRYKAFQKEKTKEKE